MRSRGIKEFSYDHVKTPYFFSSLIGYALGIILTFNAMVIFDHPQPALLFLVPCCCLSVLVCGYREGGKPQVIEVFKYDEDSIRNPTPAVAPETNKEK
jgi:minor histocompatibility antigen H13